LRFAETGFGWKPSGGGDTFTQDAANIGGAQWSRASKGYEVKIVQRGGGVVQMDGFSLEVRVTREKGTASTAVAPGGPAERQSFPMFHMKVEMAEGYLLTRERISSASVKSSRTGTLQISNIKNMP
jgi:hypothetical protein